MKSKFYFILFLSLCSIFLTVSCGDKHHDHDSEHNHHERGDKMASNNVDTITVAQFNNWTSNWAKAGKGYNDTSLVLYYQIPMIDLREVASEIGTPNARCYQGLEIIDSVNHKYIAHIIVCGADESGALVGKYYDVSRPCPPDCGR